MKKLFRLAAGLVLLAGLASCHGIGGGNTIRSLKIVWVPVSGEQGVLLTPTNSTATTATLKMYDCFCSTVVVYGYFDDGTVGDFTSRVTLTSSDPATVAVTKFDVTQPCAFTQNDPTLFTLVPKQTTSAASSVRAAGVPVTITATFVGLTATLPVTVADTAAALRTNPADPTSTSTLKFTQSDTSTTTAQVPVSGTTLLLLTGTINGTQRTFNNNVHTHFDSTTQTYVTSWVSTVPDPSAPSGTDDCTVPRADSNPIPPACHGAVSKAPLGGGTVTGISPTGTGAVTVQASFAACPSFPPVTGSVQVGDIVAPLHLAEEDNFYPATPGDDHVLAKDSNEQLKVTVPLDFDGDGGADNLNGGTFPPGPIVSRSTSLSFSDTCSVVSHDDAADPDGSKNLCTAPASQTCQSSPATPVCSSNPMTSCVKGMTPCRTVASPVVASLFNSIVANSGDVNNQPTKFIATFPSVAATGAKLTAAMAASDGTVTVDTVYPLNYPWFATIDAGGAREDVRVTGLVTGTTNVLNVIRGEARTTPAAHQPGVTFNQRSYSSDPLGLGVTGKDSGTVTSLVLADLTSSNPPPPTMTALGTLQLQAVGTYTDTRKQSVSHLVTLSSGSPTVAWSSSDTTVAVVGSNSGLVTSNNLCGGIVAIRARASTSSNTTNAAFSAPATKGDATDTDGNNNVDTNDAACNGADPLCAQVNLCVPTLSPLPEGAVCTKTTTYNSSTRQCLVQ